MAAPAKSLAYPAAPVNDDGAGGRRRGERAHVVAGDLRSENVDLAACGRQQFRFPRGRLAAAGNDGTLAFEREERRQPRQPAYAGGLSFSGIATHAKVLATP